MDMHSDTWMASDATKSKLWCMVILNFDAQVFWVFAPEQDARLRSPPSSLVEKRPAIPSLGFP